MSMVIFMKEIGKRTKHQEEEYTNTSMEQNIRDNGMMTINMDMELRLG